VADAYDTSGESDRERRSDFDNKPLAGLGDLLKLKKKE